MLARLKFYFLNGLEDEVVSLDFELLYFGGLKKRHGEF
ncbi:hypothetical protein C4K13_2488 [Pseudomonas chlororaphis subsp. aureofaciens]|nr:hypothetical protein C4K13_2488 [Pseudomonas chlororaphis subsp. aureofaciens]